VAYDDLLDLLKLHLRREGKLLYRLVGKRRFERHYRELFPGRPVPASM
jgi:hypothetical protein